MSDLSRFFDQAPDGAHCRKPDTKMSEGLFCREFATGEPGERWSAELMRFTNGTDEIDGIYFWRLGGNAERFLELPIDVLGDFEDFDEIGLTHYLQQAAGIFT